MRSKLTLFFLILILAMGILYVRGFRNQSVSNSVNDSLESSSINHASAEDLRHKSLGNQTHKLEQKITDRFSDEITKITNTLQLLEQERVKFTKQVSNPEENIYYFSMASPNTKQTIQYSKEIKKAKNLYGIRDFDETVQPWDNMLREEYIFPNHFREYIIEITEYKGDGRVRYTISGIGDTSGELASGSFAILKTYYVDDVTKQWRFQHIFKKSQQPSSNLNTQ
jgi:hypothetical protein